MEDLYIGQNSAFGVWVQQVIGGYRVITVPRADGGKAPPYDATTYASVACARKAAEGLINA